jgi:hypothetical protein
MVDGRNWRCWSKHGFGIAGKTVTLQQRSHKINIITIILNSSKIFGEIKIYENAVRDKLKPLD